MRAGGATSRPSLERGHQVAANPNGFPTPPGPDEPNHNRCPVCSYRPCTSRCKVGLSQEDLDELEAMFLPPSGEGRFATPEDPLEGEG